MFWLAPRSATKAVRKRSQQSLKTTICDIHFSQTSPRKQDKKGQKINPHKGGLQDAIGLRVAWCCRVGFCVCVVTGTSNRSHVRHAASPANSQANCRRWPRPSHPRTAHTLTAAVYVAAVHPHPASGDVPSETARAFDLSCPELIGFCPSLWNQTLKVSGLFNMGRRPRAMEFALALNYLYYVWSVWFYSLPEAEGSGCGDTWRRGDVCSETEVTTQDFGNSATIRTWD